MRADHTGQQDKGGGAVTHPLRQRNQARQDAGHFDNRDLVGTTKRVFARELHDEIQGLVGHLRERVRRVQTHWHQQGLDFTLKVTAHPLALGRIALAVRQDPVTLALQSGQQILVVQGVLTRHHGAGFFSQGGQAGLGVFPRPEALQTAHHMRLCPHLKKLIQIGRHDAQIAQTLEHRYLRAVCPVQHPLIERQDAQIAVQQGLPLVCR